MEALLAIAYWLKLEFYLDFTPPSTGTATF